MKFLDLTVGKYNRNTGELIELYELIPTLDDAHLIALKEMPDVEYGEQIVIIPRWCFNVRGLKEKQNELARRYRIMV